MPEPVHRAERSTRLRDLVADALEHTPSERAAFLLASCGTDAALLAEARSLLEYDRDANTFLETPVHAALKKGEGWEDAPAGELRPGETLGDCTIVELLGEGGMGEVYLADDTRLERRVALKLLKGRFGDETLGRRFRHERRVLAGLTHPNIARLYGGTVTPEGRSFLVMEYVEGERLDRFCQGRNLDVSGRLTLFRKVCAAVAYAHQNLVVHRDLKPANIRVTPEGEPKLLDFGIAKLLDPENRGGPAGDPTVTIHGAMTPEYASPEQIKGEAITTASDVYSLGVVLYELLCGQRPYSLGGRRPDELARAICEEEPPRPSTVAGRTTATSHGDTAPAAQTAVSHESARKLRRRLEGDLDNIVAKALRKEPGRRYPSVLALSEDIRRHCEGLPVTARKDTIRYRTGKFVRRNKVVVAAAASITLALVGGLAAATWQARVAGQERDRARLAQIHAELAQKQAERLNGFLQTLLGSANPENGPGRDLKVVQVLDRASQGIDQELAADPAILAQVHLTIGQAYTNLKEADPAIRQLQAAVDIDHRLYGDDDIRTARARGALGVALTTLQRKYDEAEPLLRAALAMERRQPAADQRDLPQLFKYLGLCLSATKHLEEAAALASESLSLTRRIYGEQSEPFAKGLTQLGYLEMNKSDYAGAEAAFRQAAAIYRQVSPGTPTFASSLQNLAYSLVVQGKLDEPEGLLQESLACYRATVGENSANYHMTLGLHGLLHFERGDYPTAEAELREGISYLRPLISKADEDVTSGMVALGLTLTREGKASEGETWLRECLEITRKYHFIGMAALDNVEHALAECLSAQKRYAEAEPLLLARHDDLKTRLGEHDARSRAAARELHELYTAWDKPAEARRFAGREAASPDPPK